MSMLMREALARGQDLMTKAASTSIVVCGAGAIGANLCESLARAGFQKITVIDFDRVEAQNLSTQPYTRQDLNSTKVKALSNFVYRAVGVKLSAFDKKLEERTIKKFLKGADIVVDAFDNSASRGLLTAYCAEHNIDCLHLGMADGFSEAIWNEDYRVPSDAQEDICDYPLARNLVKITVAMGCELLFTYLGEGEKKNVSLTLGDLRFHHRENT